MACLTCRQAREASTIAKYSPEEDMTLRKSSVAREGATAAVCLNGATSNGAWEDVGAEMATGPLAASLALSQVVQPPSRRPRAAIRGLCLHVCIDP